MLHRSALLAVLAALVLTPTLGCNDSEPLTLRLGIEEATNRLVVTVNRDLAGSETLYAQVRQGDIGVLDCASMYESFSRIDEDPIADSRVAAAFRGPSLDDASFDSPYDSAWLQQENKDGTVTPTDEMLAGIAAGTWIADVCLMDGSNVVTFLEVDVRQALDRAGEDGKFDGEEARIASTQAYADHCVDEMGEIPFFEDLGNGDYGTYNCLDSTPIPTTVTDDMDFVSFPEETVDACDNPQFIYSLCEPNAVSGRTNGPRVARRRNEQGTHWVLLCRKAKSAEGAYDDIAMIGHNPFTGKTCFFQNALYRKTDGLAVPHPGDRVNSQDSPQQSETLWEGIHGGIGSGIECAKCHDADAFIHTPWIDGALDDSGDPIVPRMGVDDDFVLGFNDAPYSILNTEGQGWTMPQQITSEEADACTRCHRMADGRWAKDWLHRLDGTDQAWTRITTRAYQQFQHTFWMPPDLEGVDADSWADSEWGQAMTFLQSCTDAGADMCDRFPLPTDPITDPGELPTINLEGDDLALEAAIILGADVSNPGDERCDGADGSCASRRCAECHSVARAGLRHWSDLTQDAFNLCFLNTDPETMSQEDAMTSVDCMRQNATDPTSVFATARLGILATGVQYGYFRDLFRRAFGDAWLPQYVAFKARVIMPKGNHPRLDQREYATVLKWFTQNLNDLDAVLPEAPRPATCTEMFDRGALDAHLDDMVYEGWTAANEDTGIRMYGCSGSDPLACLTSAPDRSSDWGAGGGTTRELRRLAFTTSYWMRSSADGRFVGNGGGTDAGATISDLQRDVDIGIDASYDPGFFPDNSGFIFQGGGAGICTQTILESASRIDFDEPGCIVNNTINLYQHVARGVAGGDYFVINSQFTSDPGGSNADPSAFFGENATMKFTPMVFNGTNFETLPEVVVPSAYEGDSVMSPSGQLVVSRVAGADGPLGYTVRRVAANRAGVNYSINIDEQLARICSPGAKVSFSLDERFITTHRYEADGSANVLLIDLRTGESSDVTAMPAGAQALFPHFRSDGWVYYLVNETDGSQYVAASDHAIRIAMGMTPPPPPPPPPPMDWMPQATAISSPHPYTNDFDQTYEIAAPAGATRLRIHFTRIDVEDNYDFVEIFDGEGSRVAKITGNHTDVTSVEIPGAAASVRLVTDYSVNRDGFDIDRIEYRTDGTPPPPPATWTRVSMASESAHPYLDDTNQTITLTAPSGATAVRVHFSRIETESGYDFVEVLDGSGRVIAEYNGTHSDVTTAPITGDTAAIRLRSDYSVTQFGYTSDYFEYR